MSGITPSEFERLMRKAGVAPDALRGLVSAHGNLANGQMIAESVPNVLVQDTAGSIGTTLTQVAFATIPGRAMGLRTRLTIGAVFDLAGPDSKDIRLFAGPASGTFATATGFGGLFGLTTQRWAPLWGLLYAENSTTALRGNASGQGDWPRANTGGNSIAVALDTSLDWNIYVGVKFNAAANGNSATLRNFWVQVLG